MATDLHIHIDEGLTQLDFHCMFANHTGSWYEKELFYRCAEEPRPYGGSCPHRKRIWEAPEILVGETPWPHVYDLRQQEEFGVPDPMGRMEDIFPVNGHLPVTITPGRIRLVEEALDVPERWTTEYRGFPPRERLQEVVEFLKAHEGKGAFLLFH